MQDWRWMSAADLGRGIGAGQIDPVALTDVFLEAIDAHEHRDRIYARVTHDRAKGEAQAAADRAKAGLRRGPLDGVPISWKDNFDTAGVATEAGTRLMEGRVPDQEDYPNPFRAQWAHFLRHVVLNEPFPWNLREGAKGVQLAEAAMLSSKLGKWVAVEELEV